MLKDIRTDERLESVRQKILAEGFVILLVLLTGALGYRLFYLKQPVRELLDITIIVCVGCLYIGIRSATSGFFDKDLKEIRLHPGRHICKMAIMYILGIPIFWKIPAWLLGEKAVILTPSLFGRLFIFMLLYSFVFYFFLYLLNLLWKKRNKND